MNPEFNLIRTINGKGYKHSDETKKKLSKIHKERLSKLNKEENEKRLCAARMALKRRVMCVDTGVVYESISEAEERTGSRGICAVCRNRRNSANNLRFKYVE